MVPGAGGAWGSAGKGVRFAGPKTKEDACAWGLDVAPEWPEQDGQGEKAERSRETQARARREGTRVCFTMGRGRGERLGDKTWELWSKVVATCVLSLWGCKNKYINQNKKIWVQSRGAGVSLTQEREGSSL